MVVGIGVGVSSLCKVEVSSSGLTVVVAISHLEWMMTMISEKLTATGIVDTRTEETETGVVDMLLMIDNEKPNALRKM